MGFDPTQYKSTTRQQWEDAAEAWHRWGPLLEQWLGEATTRMLDAAGVGAGTRVLDVAAGAGGQSLAAARRGAHVVATDISPSILEYAEKQAAEHGFTVQTIEADGERLGEKVGDGYDAVISRLGLIYFPDQAGAAAGFRDVLAPGGRMSVLVYSTPQRNGFFAGPVSVIRARAGLPTPGPGLPGPFSVGSPGVLEELLTRAGFRDVTVEAIDAPLRLPSAAECLRFERESFGALHQMLAGVPDAEREDIWDEVHQVLRQYQNGNGFDGPCELLVGSGTR
jgi:SAM-dependent methyltransferase